MFDEAYVEELAARRGQPCVTSLYLDVDGKRYARPADFEPHVTHLFHVARTRAARIGAAAEAAVGADLDQIRRWLDAGIDRSATRGVAVFSNAAGGYFEPVLLPVAVRDEVSIELGPSVAQLLGILERRRRSLVVLVDRRQARFLRVELGGVTERPALVDEIERQADTDVELGGWERRREEATRRHYRRVVARTAAEVRAWSPHDVILGGSHDDVARLEGCIDNAVADLVTGPVRLTVRSSPDEVAAAVLTIVRDLERRREEALVEELHERAPQRRKAALGVPAVMAALAEHRVETLVVARGFHAPGAQCPACGHVGVAACQCPECGTPSVEFDDIIDDAIRQALAQDATVEICEGTDLEFFGGFGALERF